MAIRLDIPFVVAAARVAVGVVLAAAPQAPLPTEDAANGTSVFLMRTIGIRDLVLGGGALFARARGRDAEFARWAAAGLASDVGDALATIGSVGLLGRGGAAKSVAIVAPWIAAGVVGLRGRRTASG